ncbi:oxidoreductase-like protein [Aspergillus egyptiacus]|nr:oxidoreductase-like protein [Aspergillus egyptiacus]
MEGRILASTRQRLLKATSNLILSRTTTLTSQGCRQFHATPSPQLRTHGRVNSNPNTDGADTSQAYPLTGYYSDILSARSSQRGQATTSPTAAQHKPNEPSRDISEQTPEQKMAIVFGTRLAGPGRSSRYKSASNSVWKTVNGVPVPPRPEEPDNCCMSGCVHCVWDDYRDEMEEWAAMLAQAKAKGPKKSPSVIPGAIPKTPADPVSTSMDDDGGGSETNWSLPGSEDDLFADIPVGIREFMKTEKKLKQAHRQEANSS